MLKRNQSVVQLENAINDALHRLENLQVESEEYAQALAHIERLQTIRDQFRKSRVSPDTWLVVGANLLGILLVVKYEHENVITTRAMSMMNMVKKP